MSSRETLRFAPLLLVGFILMTACSNSGTTATPQSSASAVAQTVPTPISPTGSTPSLPSTSTTTTPAPQGLSPSSTFGMQPSPCVYGIVGGQAALPDPRCTPGSTNPAVSQATINSTICVSGYTATIRPSESVTYPEKLGSMAAYGRSDSTRNYEYDHLVSLELGGAANSASNLWPEELLGAYGARVKDSLENRLHALVCAGSLSLATAQYEEATNWIAAYNKYVGPLG